MDVEDEKIRDAVKHTEILRLPKQSLATFGTTNIYYYLVTEPAYSELVKDVIETVVREGRLNFMVYFRSWDLWAGFPSNLAAIQLLKEYMAGEIGVDDGELIAMSKGMHLYEYAWELAKTAVRME